MRDDPLFVGVTNAAGTRPGYVPEVPFKGEMFGVSRSLDAESGMICGETLKEDGEWTGETWGAVGRSGAGAVETSM